MSNWIVGGGSVIGSSHLSHGEEKQDNFAIVEDKKGNVAFCLSDGAGSSKKSQLSSSFTAQFMAEKLSKLPEMIEDKGPGSWINDYIIQCIIDLRSFLYKEFDTYDLVDYHCTLVSGIFFENTCLVAHIGDGAVLCGTSNLTNNQCILNEKLYLSKPENGEYKNETYFLTESTWLKHLRITPFSNVSWLIAGTDGGIDLLSVGDRLKDELVYEILSDFIDCPLSKKNKHLEQTMSTDQADEKTNDDKSLVIIASNEITKETNRYWPEENNSLSDFYPKIQKKNSSSTTAYQNPSIVFEGENVTSRKIKKNNIIGLIFGFFHKRTTLTVCLLLTVVVSSYLVLNFVIREPDELLNNDVAFQNPVAEENNTIVPDQAFIPERDDAITDANLQNDNSLQHSNDDASNSVEVDQNEDQVVIGQEAAEESHATDHTNNNQDASTEHKSDKGLINDAVKNAIDSLTPEIQKGNNNKQNTEEQVSE